MPKLAHEQHEAFAQAWAKLPPGPVKVRGAAAAQEAGYYPEPVKAASRLRANPTVAARILELTGRVEERADDLTAWREKVQKMTASAQRAKQFAPAMKGLELLGKSSGYLNETLTLNNPKKDVPDETLAAQIADVFSDLGVTKEQVVTILRGRAN